MGILTRATKNLSRRKTRALIVIIALSLALTLVTILPPSINAGKTTTQQIINELNWNVNFDESMATQSATEIRLPPSNHFEPRNSERKHY